MAPLQTILELLMEARPEIVGGLVLSLITAVVGGGVWLLRRLTKIGRKQSNEDANLPDKQSLGSVKIVSNIKASNVVTVSDNQSPVTVIIGPDSVSQPRVSFPGMDSLLTLDDSRIANFIEDLKKVGYLDEGASGFEKMVYQLQEYGRVLACPGETRFFDRTEWSIWLSILSRLSELTVVSPNLASLKSELIAEIERRLKYLVETTAARQEWEESYALQKALVTLKPLDQEAAKYLARLEKAISIARREPVCR